MQVYIDMSTTVQKIQIAWYESLNWLEIRNVDEDAFCFAENVWERCETIHKEANWSYVQLKANSTAVRIQNQVYGLNKHLSVNYDSAQMLLKTSPGVKYVTRMQSDRQDRWALLSHQDDPFGVSFQSHRIKHLWRYCRIQPVRKEEIGPAWIGWLPPTQKIEIQLEFDLRGKRHWIRHEHTMERLPIALRFTRQSILPNYPDEVCWKTVENFQDSIDASGWLAGDRIMFKAPEGCILVPVVNGRKHEPTTDLSIEKKPSHFRKPWSVVSESYRRCELSSYAAIAGRSGTDWEVFSQRYPWLSKKIQRRGFRFFERFPLGESLMACSPELLHGLERNDA
ncbi:MAG: hypothetical protein VX278_16425 [Myxococcota bacterium]|nr:hypothetical protein [Myxococcota bacterium]